MTKLAGLAPGHLPTVADPCAIAGGLTKNAARALGLKAGIPVVVGGGDDIEVLGNGLMAPGLSLEHLGTTGSILTCSEHLVFDPHMALEVYPHAAPGLWVLGGSVTTAGMAMNWAERVLNAHASEKIPESSFTVEPGAPLIFIPHLSGERCPDWEPSARGGWVGLSTSSTAEDLYQAVLEGIAFSLKNVLERIESLAGAQQAITVGRREVQNPAWLNLRAAIYNRPLTVLNTEEPTALGAMILAAAGIGIYPDLAEAVKAVTGAYTRVDPVERQARQYQQLYRMYQETGDHLRKLMLFWQSMHTS
jgi:xylulokinase